MECIYTLNINKFGINEEIKNFDIDVFSLHLIFIYEYDIFI